MTNYYLKTLEGVSPVGNVDLSTQLITSGSEYTIIDETDKTIAYVDENGELHVIEKRDNSFLWLLAALAVGAILV